MISLGLVASACSCVPTPAPEAADARTPKTTPEKAENQASPSSPKLESAPIKEIDASRLFALRGEGKALIYDVRLPLYFKLGHIDGATLFYPKPFDEAFAREKPAMEAALREGKEIILYCGGADCHDSHIVAKMIAQKGIPVSVYSGGWAEWKEIGIE